MGETEVACDGALCETKPDVLCLYISRSPASVLSRSGWRQVSEFRAVSSKNTQEWLVSERKRGGGLFIHDGYTHNSIFEITVWEPYCVFE